MNYFGFFISWEDFQDAAADEEFKVNLEGHNDVVLRTL